MILSKIIKIQSEFCSRYKLFKDPFQNLAHTASLSSKVNLNKQQFEFIHKY